MSESTKLPRRYRRDHRGRYTLRPEWVRSDTVINVGLIVLGVYILQALISTGVNDVAGRVAIVAWVVALPQLALLAVFSQVLSEYRYFSYPWYLGLARSLGQIAALVGFGGALWRLWAPATLILAASSFVALLVYAFAYGRLVQENPEDKP